MSISFEIVIFSSLIVIIASNLLVPSFEFDKSIFEFILLPFSK